MKGKVRSFKRILSNEGAWAALGETWRALTPSVNQLPSPHRQKVKFYQKFTRQARASPLPLSQSFSLVREGFLPQAHCLYDFDEHGTDAYLPDYAKSVDAWSINEPEGYLLDDKLTFHQVLDERGFADVLPRLHGVLGETLEAPRVPALLQDHGSLVLKDRRGGGGSRVHLARSTPAGLSVDGEPVSEEELVDFASSLAGYLVTEFCKPAPYARDLHPGTPNTVRIVTMNPEQADPFVACAVHRIGAKTTGSVDNFSQGGLSAGIREDGRLTRGVRLVDWEAKWTARHPDTGTPLEDAVVPGWRRIQDEVLGVAQAMPETPYVGWDLIVTGKGSFSIIEANTNTDVDLLQAHTPLLLDPQVLAFYQEHGIA